MGAHPINLALRFILELSALVAIGYWGWSQSVGWLRFGLAIGLPVLAATLWGTFAVPDDPSRSGKAPVPVPGWLRLVIELGTFAVATWALFAMGNVTLGWTIGVLVVIHYLVSYDRIQWLLSR